MNPTAMGAPADTKAALQALGKRIIENSTLYHYPKSTDGLASPGGNVQLPPKKQKLDNNNINNTTTHNNNNNNKGDNNNNNNNRSKEEQQGQRDPYLTYEQYENLLYRGKPQQLLHQKDQLGGGDGPTTTTTTTTTTSSMMNDQSVHHLPVDTLISDLPYDVNHSSMPLASTLSNSLSSSLASSLSSSLSSNLPSTIDTSSLAANLSLSSSLAHHHNLSSLIPPNQMALIASSHAPHSPHSPLAHTQQQQQQQQQQSPHSPVSQLLGTPTSIPSPNSSSGATAAHAVALLANAENQKIQRKKANQQEREVLEKYYNEHYVDQSVKIRKEDLTELAYTLNWHVLRVQGWMHTHRQSRSDYNPPKRTKRRATLPQEQDILKHYFKIWTEQGLIDLHSPTRVTPKDYEVVATALGWDNERVRRWTDHYKQKIKAASEGNP